MNNLKDWLRAPSFPDLMALLIFAVIAAASCGCSQMNETTYREVQPELRIDVAIRSKIPWGGLLGQRAASAVIKSKSPDGSEWSIDASDDSERADNTAQADAAVAISDAAERAVLEALRLYAKGGLPL